MNTQNPKDTLPEPNSSIGKKTFTGKVVSAKAQKTITVLIETQRKDATYQKFVKKCKKFLAHDENGLAKEGDIVTIVESRPISKKKFFVLKEVVRAAIKVGVSE